jgi:hypothetical protein
MSVQDNFFLPRDLHKDSILNQGVKGAAGYPQLIGGSSLAGGHQGSAAGSGWNLGGRGQSPLTRIRRNPCNCCYLCGSNKWLLCWHNLPVSG